MRLVGEGLHHADAADILLDPGIEGGDTTVLRLPVPCHATAVAEGDEGDHRQDGGGQEGQRRVDVDHQREGADQGHHRDEEVLRAVMGDLADLLQILGDAGDEVTGLLVVEIAERELLQMIEGTATHLGLDIDAEHVPPIGHHHHEAGIGHVDHAEAEGGEHDQLPVLARQQHIHEGLHGHGKAQFEQARQDRAAEIDKEQGPVRAVISEEVLQHDAFVR